MNTAIIIAYFKKSRQSFLSLIEDLSLEELNEVPAGFNNNIVWNFGHIIVSTLGLCYIRSQAKPELALPFPGRFGKGTYPELPVTAEELQILKKLATTTIEQLEADLATDIFEKIEVVNTDTFQVPMQTIEEVMMGSVIHENLHLGTAKAQKQLLLEARRVKQRAAEALN